jgi:lipopolysaccharide transport system permease protein
MAATASWSRLAGDARELIREQFEYRELLYQIICRDLLLRYKQTVMGFAWAVLTPVLNTIIFSVLFMRVAPIETPVPYPLFVYCGLVAWNFTAASLRFAVTSLTSNTNLVTKVYFPREIFPFAAVAVALVDSAVAAIVVVGLVIYYDVAMTPYLMLVPVIVVVQTLFTCGLALLLAMGNLLYRDVKYLFDAVLTVWLFASAVVYPSESVGGVLGIIINANPMTGLVEAYRHVVLYGTAPGPSFIASTVVTLLLFPAAWLLFHRCEFRFAERI